MAMPALGTAASVAAAGVGAGLVLLVAVHLAGPAGALAPAALVAGLILLRYPGAALAALLVSVALIETDVTGVIPPYGAFYEVAGASLTPPDLILLAGLCGVLVRAVADGRRPVSPGPMTVPLTILGLAVAYGAVTGYFADTGVANGELFHRSINAFYLILVPLLIVNVVRDRSGLLVFATVAAAIGVIKSFSGVLGALSGIGETINEETVTFFDPLPNLAILLVVLGVAAALVRHERLPAWLLAGAPIGLLALLLSYRRSFWVATAFTLAVVVIIASRRRGRAVFALAAVAVAIAVAGSLTIASTDPYGGSTLAQRAQTLNPTGSDVNRGDRYRNDERRNVIANLREEPLTGRGLGVPWTVHYPLAEDHDRRYTHVALLWFWLALGPMGALAYLLVMASGLWTASRVWSRHPDPRVQIAAIACFGGILGMVVVELTATFTGVEPRLSIAMGALLGWAAAAWADLPANRPPELEPLS